MRSGRRRGEWASATGPMNKRTAKQAFHHCVRMIPSGRPGTDVTRRGRSERPSERKTRRRCAVDVDRDCALALARLSSPFIRLLLGLVDGNCDQDSNEDLGASTCVYLSPPGLLASKKADVGHEMLSKMNDGPATMQCDSKLLAVSSLLLRLPFLLVERFAVQRCQACMFRRCSRSTDLLARRDVLQLTSLGRLQQRQSGRRPTLTVEVDLSGRERLRPLAVRDSPTASTLLRLASCCRPLLRLAVRSGLTALLIRRLGELGENVLQRGLLRLLLACSRLFVFPRCLVDLLEVFEQALERITQNAPQILDGVVSSRFALVF